MTSSIQERLISVIKSEIPGFKADFDLSADLRVQLGLDSLSYVELILEVEEEFGIKLSDAEAEELVSFRDLLTLIERKIPKGE